MRSVAAWHRNLGRNQMGHRTYQIIGTQYRTLTHGLLGKKGNHANGTAREGAFLCRAYCSNGRHYVDGIPVTNDRSGYRIDNVADPCGAPESAPGTANQGRQRPRARIGPAAPPNPKQPDTGNKPK